MAKAKKAAPKKAAPKKAASKKADAKKEAAPKKAEESLEGPLVLDVFAESIETAGHQNLINLKSAVSAVDDPSQMKVVAQVYIPASHPQARFFSDKKAYKLTAVEAPQQSEKDLAPAPGKDKIKKKGSKAASKSASKGASKSASKAAPSKAASKSSKK